MQNALQYKIIRWLLFATAFMPLVLKRDVFFPFVFPKMLFFRSLTELALILFLGVLAYEIWQGGGYILSRLRAVRRYLKNPLVISVGLFFLSLGISTALAVNDYRAFWGDIERAEGFFGMLHYLIFMALVAVMFRAKDWIRYFTLTVGVGALLALHAIAEYMGLTFLPFVRSQAPRPGSLVGNPAFLATHFIFMITFSGALFALWKRKGSDTPFKKYALIAVAIVSTLGIFLTGTRGAILGLFGALGLLLAYYALEPILRGSWKKESAPDYDLKRKIAALLLILIIFFGGIFWATRESSAWQNVPGLARLAETGVLDPNDPSTQTRILTWQVSWEAFLEKPIFGWGPENYLLAYQKYYDPDYALYGETWLDRAHNKFFDLLVMQGVLGVMAYIAMFLSFIFLLIKKKVPGKEIIIAGLAAYTAQNLVLFDQPLSYMLLFALFGYALFWSGEEEAHPSPVTTGSLAKPVGVLLSALALGLVWTLYAYNYVPYAESKIVYRSPGFRDTKDVAGALREGFSPYNFAQLNIRTQALDSIYLEQYFQNQEYRSNPRFSEIGEVLVGAIEDLMAREPYDARIIIRASQMYDPMANEDPELYKRIEEILQVAKSLAPERQELYYHSAVNLAKQDRVDEALEEIEYAVSLSPRVPRARFHYALILAAAGRIEEAMENLLLLEELDPDFDTLLGTDHNSVMLLWNSWGRPDKIAELAHKSLAGNIDRTFGQVYYEIALQYYAQERDTDKFIRVAEYLRDAVPEYHDDMEIFIDLAQQGLWNIILSHGSG